MAYDFSPLKKNITDTEEWLTRELSGIRTGRATPTLLDGVRIDAYGSHMPIKELASVSVEDARTLRLIPWDATLLKALEKGITDANLGVGVSADGEGVRISFPELTSERRVQLTKLASEKTEQAKVRLRVHRTDTLKELEAAEKEGGMGKDDLKRLKDEVQKFIDAGNAALVSHLEKKEAEIAH